MGDVSVDMTGEDVARRTSAGLVVGRDGTARVARLRGLGVAHGQRYRLGRPRRRREVLAAL